MLYLWSRIEISLHHNNMRYFGWTFGGCPKIVGTSRSFLELFIENERQLTSLQNVLCKHMTSNFTFETLVHRTWYMVRDKEGGNMHVVITQYF